MNRADRAAKRLAGMVVPVLTRAEGKLFLRMARRICRRLARQRVDLFRLMEPSRN